MNKNMIRSIKVILAVSSVLASHILLTSCAGYDTKVGVDYTDPQGWAAGANVDVSKLPSMAK